jgi:pilus assembly protein Flp/PilA
MLRKLINYSRRAAREEDGITAVEYAVLAALVAVALIAVVPTLQAALSTGFTKIQTIITTGKDG